MTALPPHVATADETIPEPSDHLRHAPDVRAATSIDVMLAVLDEYRDDAILYVDQLRHFLATVGVSLLASYNRAGELSLTVGSPCDSQIRHRSRYTHFLIEDLDRVEGRRDALMSLLIRAGYVCDARRTNPPATTRAMRDFLLTDGRILMTPDGQLEEGGGAPSGLTHGTAEEFDECIRAGRAYLEVRKRYRADRQIKRAVRMLGTRTDNGWMVLEARS